MIHGQHRKICEGRKDQRPSHHGGARYTQVLAADRSGSGEPPFKHQSPGGKQHADTPARDNTFARASSTCRPSARLRDAEHPPTLAFAVAQQFHQSRDPHRRRQRIQNALPAAPGTSAGLLPCFGHFAARYVAVRWLENRDQFPKSGSARKSAARSNRPATATATQIGGVASSAEAP